MPSHTETRVLPYTPEQLYDLVAAVDRYPEFLPWCKASRILSQSDIRMVADLIIGYKIFHEKFRSDVTLQRPHEIIVNYVSGPMAKLKNHWRFDAAPGGACALTFHVDFDFKSPFLQAAIDAFFDKALRKMVEAFEMRAATLYGRKGIDGG